MPKLTYLTNCVSSTAEAINDMTEQAREVTWRTFIKHVDLQSVKEVFPFYSYHRETCNSAGELVCPMHIKDDYCVSFWKSKYKGEPCYYVSHSAIEYIFT